MKYFYITFFAIMLSIGSCQEEKIIDKTHTEDGIPIVYYTRHITGDSILLLFRELGIEPSGKVAVKVHFGEDGNDNYLSPELSKPLTLAYNGILVETNILYNSRRAVMESHIDLAKEHGFTFAPIDILDSDGDSVIKCNTKHYKRVIVGKKFFDYDTYIIFSHFKGHGMSGYGGAIKNIAMGLASPTGKKAQHASYIPDIDLDKCIDCGICARACPSQAIEISPVWIDKSKCTGCGQCVTECPQKAVSLSTFSRELFMERLCDYTDVISKQRPMIYVNIAANISALCDCAKKDPEVFMDDVGVFASTDIIAIEQASYDMVNKYHGSADAFEKGGKGSGIYQIDYAADSLKMGSKKYKLVIIDED